MMTRDKFIDVRDLPECVRSDRSGAGDGSSPIMSLAELERSHAHRTLKRLQGNKVKTAAAMGISRATLYRLLEETDTELSVSV